MILNRDGHTIEIRGMRPEEDETQRELLFRSYREYASGPEDPRFFDRSAHGRLQRADPGILPEQTRMLLCDGVPASTATVYLWRERHSGRTPLVGLIGGVCTHPDYRKRGYVRLLMEDALAFMRRKRCALSRLYGKEEVYGSSGYRSFTGYRTLEADVDLEAVGTADRRSCGRTERCGADGAKRSRVAGAGASSGGRTGSSVDGHLGGTPNRAALAGAVRPVENPADVPRLMEIHEEWNRDLSGPIVRSRADWEYRVLGSKARKGWDRFFIVEQAGRAIGYYQLLENGVIGELGAEEATVSEVLNHAARATDGALRFSFCCPRLEEAVRSLPATVRRKEHQRHGMWRLFEGTSLGLPANADTGDLLALLETERFLCYSMDRF